MATLQRERELEYAVIIDGDGRVLHNALQMDDPVIIRDYDDGTRHLVSSRTGQLIIAPFDPKTAERAHCPHCGCPLGAFGGG